jgi:hypothetical protein
MDLLTQYTIALHSVLVRSTTVEITQETVVCNALFCMVQPDGNNRHIDTNRMTDRLKQDSLTKCIMIGNHFKLSLAAIFNLKGGTDIEAEEELFKLL